MKLTDWFPPDTKPKRKGMYETQLAGVHGYSFWSGHVWGLQYTSLEVGEKSSPTHGKGAQHKKWRGLAEKPE